jgi:hypothetical protein
LGQPSSPKIEPANVQSPGGVYVDAAAKDIDHMIGAEERFMVAMARQ